jgi:HD superfamily phosphodiesterase
MNFLKSAEKFARVEYAKNDENHKWTHVEEVMINALKIANSLSVPVDLELLKLAVIFHDIDYESYETHVDNSVLVMESFLKKQNYPIERIAKIKEIMLDHSGPHRRKLGEAKTIEGKIMYDADKSVCSSKDIKSYEKYYPTFYLDSTRRFVKKPKK